MTYIKVTQEQLDAAKYDATLLPFGVIFRSLYGSTKHKEIFRKFSELDDSFSVLLVTEEYKTEDDWDYFDFNNADQLEVIK